MLRPLKNNPKQQPTQETHADGQTAIEYMLLLAVVVAIVLTSFRISIPMAYNHVNTYFNNVAPGILGPGPRCGDRICNAPRDGYGVHNPPFETCKTCPSDCCCTAITGNCP